MPSRDREIQELLAASAGDNLGLDFLPGALPFTPVADGAPDPALAAAIVWFDALVTNVDRTARNPNLLWWGNRLWLIDHGAALYVHHSWSGPGVDVDRHARRPFRGLAEHVLRPYAGPLQVADADLAPRIDCRLLERLTGLVPADWLGGGGRAPYVDYLLRRLSPPRPFLDEVPGAGGPPEVAAAPGAAPELPPVWP